MDLNLIKEKEQNREKYTRALLERLKQEGIKQQFDDEFLVKFLRSRLYDVNKTCFAIKNYLTIFKKYPQFFTKIEFIKDAIEEEFFEMLPHRNITGETLCILRGGKWIPSKISLDKCVAATVYASEFDKLDEEAQINGSIEIIDLKDTGLRQFSKIGISEIRMAIDLSENSLPIRWRKIFVVNENYLADAVFGMAKPFLSEQFKEKIEFIGSDYSQLLKLIPRNLLPIEYGGTFKKGSGEEFFRRLAENESRIMKLWEPFKEAK